MKRVQGMLTGAMFLSGTETSRQGELGLWNFKPELAQIAASPRLAAVRRLDLGKPNGVSYSEQYDPRFAPLPGDAFAVLFESPHLAGLQSLYINELKLGPLLTERIAALPALEEVSLETCALGEDGVRMLVANKSLRWMNLANNEIGPAGAAMLAEWLSANPSRRVLLGDNRIELRGARAVIEATASGGQISLPHCGLTATDVVELAAVPAIARADWIDLSRNLVRDVGALALAAVPFVSPPSLNLVSCAIHDDAALALVPVARALDLRGNQLQQLERFVGPSAHLQSIGLTGNPGATAYDETNEGGVVIWAGSRDLSTHELKEKFGFPKERNVW